jgi:hypothetical protein
MNESPRSLRWDWIAFGWFLAVGLTSLLLLALSSFGLLVTDAGGETLWVAVALAVGFFVIGVFVGTRVVAAPVLHGVAMALCTLVAWLAVNLLVGEPFGETTWRSLDALTAAGLLVLQAAAAVVGARIGVRWMRSPPPST